MSQATLCEIYLFVDKLLRKHKDDFVHFVVHECDRTAVRGGEGAKKKETHPAPFPPRPRICDERSSTPTSPSGLRSMMHRKSGLGMSAELRALYREHRRRPVVLRERLWHWCGRGPVRRHRGAALSALMGHPPPIRALRGSDATSSPADRRIAGRLRRLLRRPEVHTVPADALRWWVRRLLRPRVRFHR